MLYLKNLWYSYLSRRLWETPKLEYGICPAHDYYGLIALYVYGILVWLFRCMNTYAKIPQITTLNISILVFFIILPLILIIILNGLVSRSTGLHRWVVEQYALEKDKKIKQNDQQCNAQRNNPIFFNCFFRKRQTNNNISNRRGNIPKYKRDQTKDFSAIAIITNGQNINDTHKSIDQRKNNQNNNSSCRHEVVLAQNNYQRHKYRYCIKDCTTGKNQNLIKNALGVKTPTLKITLPAKINIFGENNFCEKKSKPNKNRFRWAANGYFPWRSIKQSGKKEMTKFVNDKRAISRYRRKHYPDNQNNNIIQNKHLLSEYSKLDKILWLAISTVWVPLAIVDGGLRPARQLNNKPYNKTIPLVDGVLLPLILCLYGLLFWGICRLLFLK